LELSSYHTVKLERVVIPRLERRLILRSRSRHLSVHQRLSRRRSTLTGKLLCKKSTAEIKTGRIKGGIVICSVSQHNNINVGERMGAQFICIE